MLHIETTIRLLQRQLVVHGRGHLLIAVVAEFIDVPDEQTGIGQTCVAAGALAILENEILGRAALVDQEVVTAGSQRVGPDGCSVVRLDVQPASFLR